VASTQASYFSGGNLLLHGGGEKPAFLSAAQPTAAAQGSSAAQPASATPSLKTTQETSGG